MSTVNHTFVDEFDEDTPLSVESAQATWYAYGALVMLATLAYWAVLRYTSTYWDQGLYSHGWIVPLLAMGLAYSRAPRSAEFPTNVAIGGGIAAFVLFLAARFSVGDAVDAAGQPIGLPAWFAPLVVMIILGVFVYSMRDVQMYQVSNRDRWAGVGLVLLSTAAWLWCSRISADDGDRLSYLGVLFGLTLMFGGVRMLKWAGPAVAFIIFMFPLPAFVENSLLLFLQKLAAISSTWVLQLLGNVTMREGNRLIIDMEGSQLPLEVADACSGLRMLTIFGAMSVAVALLMDRPWWDRLAVLVSAIPIALITNIIRIVATAVLLQLFFDPENPDPEGGLAQRLIHDWAGLVMMPIALGILWLEYEVLTRLSIPIDNDEEYPSASVGAGAV